MTRVLPAAIEHLARRFHSRPLHVYAVHGPGRSYGVEAGFAGFRFPPISECKLFARVKEHLEVLGTPHKYAILTDIGNDIGYRCGSARILEWVLSAIERIQAMGFLVRVTALPAESVGALSRWKFEVLRRVFFPFSPLTLEEARRELRSVAAGLDDLSRSHGFGLLRASPEEYSFDAIHLRLGAAREVFSRWIDETLRDAELDDGGGPERERPVRLRVSRLRLHTRLPETYSVLGVRRARSEEGLEVATGVTLFSY